MQGTSQFVWCQTGIPSVDAQHRAMFRTIEDLLDANFHGHGPDQLDKTLKFLGSYIEYHFQCEATIMTARDYPDLADHLQHHAAFRLTFAEMQARVEREKTDPVRAAQLCEDLGEWLAAWLIEHIGESDRRLGEFVAASPQA